MPNKSIRILAALFVLVALLGAQLSVRAEQLNKSVSDCFDPDAKCDEPAISSDKATSDSKQSTEIGVTFWDFLRMIFATIFVIALLYFLLKFINKKSKVFKSSQLVENLGGTSLGANRSIQIVKAGNQLLIVGVGENIQLLKEINDPEEYRTILEEYNNKMEQLVQPSDIVTKIIERAKNLQTKQNDGSSFTTVLKKQLDEISKGRKKFLNELEKKGSDKHE